MKIYNHLSTVIFTSAVIMLSASADEHNSPKALIDGSEPGWVSLSLSDFEQVNCYEDTWQMRDDGVIYCTGEPIGVVRSKKVYTNFELLVEWRHLKPGGNSGVFAWSPMEALEGLNPGELPGMGIEIQMLDHDFKRQYEERSGRTGDWFSTNGDVFPVGKSKLNPFPPLSPNGARSFPSKDLSNGHGEWNHYYVRCINGEVRLWVNGEEVSGGNGAEPASGHLCLESEGSPIEFKNLKIRELP